MDAVAKGPPEPENEISGTTKAPAPRRKRRKKAAAAAPVSVALDPVEETLEVAAPAAQQRSEPVEDLKKKELIDLVVERSGVKKRDAKPAIEAALAILGQALEDERGLNLKPLGKLKVSNTKSKENAKVFNLRLRRSAGHAAS